MDGFEIGLCWGTLQGASVVELIELAARHGFPTITLRPDMLVAAVEDGPGEAAIRRHLADAGVRVTMIDSIIGGLPGQPPPDRVNPAGFDLARSSEEAARRAARAVDAPTINITHYGGDPATPRAVLADALRLMCERAAAHGLTILIEFVPDTAFGSIGAAAEIVRAVGAPNCAITLDPWHLARSGGTVDDIRALPPGMIGAMQLCDRIAPPPGAAYVPLSGRDLPGEGELPLCDITRAALFNRPGLSAELEVFSEELKRLPNDAAAARAAAATRSWRGGCGPFAPKGEERKL